MPVEVGSRGFTSYSLSKAFGTITEADRRRATGNDVEAVEKASSQMALVEEGGALGVARYPDTGWGLISLGRVAWREEGVCCRTPNSR